MANIQFNLRVPQELKDRIEEAAKRSGRSINAEAAYRLDKGLRPSSPYPAGHVVGYDPSIRIAFDDAFFDDTGLTKVELSQYISEVIKKDLKNIAHKKDK